jgi:chlorobactene glucosyltransferase
MEILTVFILAFLALRTIVSLVNALSGLHLPKKKPSNFPKISVLIPARNEEAAIGKLLRTLERQDYPDFEVIVCDDHSSDNTGEIVNWYSGEDRRFHIFLSEKLPEDWLGKNFACHQLARKASGKYLIFLDADVELSPNTLSRAVAFFQMKKLSLLSIFPQQRMETIAELSVVPVMNWILQSLLPMILVQKTRFPSLSAANGQFMMFDGDEYRERQWHSKVRSQNVEDIRLARLVKSEGMKMAVLLGDRDIFCRMYHSWSEAIRGFSRNVHQYFGGSRAVLAGFWLIILSGPFIVWAVWGEYYPVLFMLLVLINRLLVALAARQSVWSVLLHPVQMISFSSIVFYHLYRHAKKDTEWKGRRISF